MSQERCGELFRKARSSLESNDITEALSLGKKAYSLCEQSELKEKVEIVLFIADTYFLDRKLAQAEEWYKTAIMQIKELFGVDDPYHVHPLLRLGIICRLQEEYETSERFFLVAYDIYSDAPGLVEREQAEVLLVELAEFSLTLRSQYATALQYYSELDEFCSEADCTITSNPFIQLKKILCFLCLGQYEDAGLLIERFVAESADPLQSIRFFVLSGFHEHFAGNLSKECAMYEQGLSLSLKEKDCEDYLLLRYLTASYNLRVGNDARALEHIEALIKEGELHGVERDAPDGEDYSHLREAGFHMATQLRERDAHMMRSVLVRAIDSYMANRNFLTAYILLDNICHASVAIRGEREPLEERLNSISQYLVLP